MKPETTLDVYSEYAVVKAEMSVLEMKAKQLQKEIIKDMASKNQEKVLVPYGSFSIQKRKTWSYPDYVVEKELEVKALKAKAESTEEAIASVSESLRYTPIKL